MGVFRLLVLAVALHAFGAAPAFAARATGPADRAGADSSGTALPLVEVAANPDTGACLVVWLTGDGGWGETDQGAAGEIASRGVPVVGFNTLHYFWHRHPPDETASDLARVLRHYLETWNKRQAVMVGYSMGGAVLPFVVNRLPADLRSSLRAVVLLGPSRAVDFQFHLTSWVGNFSHQGDLPVLPEIERIHATPVLCFYGEKDKDCICPDLPSGVATVLPLRGGHRVGGHYQAIADSVMVYAR